MKEENARENNTNTGRVDQAEEESVRQRTATLKLSSKWRTKRKKKNKKEMKNTEESLCDLKIP